MSSEVNEMRLVMFDQISGRDPSSLLPNEIHLSMNRTERQARLEYQQHAAIEEKTRAQHTDDYRHQVVTLIACNSYHTIPHAEINTAGVIIAVRTAMADDIESIPR
jgi:hypothetical protein